MNYGVCLFPPPSQSDHWIEMGPGHWVHFRDYFDAIDLMAAISRSEFFRKQYDCLQAGENLDLFGSIDCQNY